LLYDIIKESVIKLTELETIKRAKMYIDKLANGINPLDDSSIPEDDIVNNVRISRCFFFISDILNKVIENDGKYHKQNKNKADFNISFEDIQKFSFSDNPIPVSKITERINNLIDTENMKQITYKNISDWLISIDMLEQQTNSEGKNIKKPTASGREMGISTEERWGRRGYYMAILYNRKAQQFIIDNIEAIKNMISEKKYGPKVEITERDIDGIERVGKLISGV